MFHATIECRGRKSHACCRRGRCRPPWVLLTSLLVGAALGQTTERVSVSSTGEEANAESGLIPGRAMSADGRHVAFWSYADNLVEGDTNFAVDIFVHDRHTGRTGRVNVDSEGREANRLSEYAAVSSDGRFVAFISYADNLVPDDTNNAADVFVRDRDPDGNGVFDEGNGITTRVSVSSTGEEGNAGSGGFPVLGVDITADGRLVVFASGASNLVRDDTNGLADVFVHECQSGETTRVSIASDGTEANGASGEHTAEGDFGPAVMPGFSVSSDGRYVTFHSVASNLTEDSLLRCDIEQVYLHDRHTGVTTLVSVSIEGDAGNQRSYWPSVSADGRIIAFTSQASDLIPGPVLARHVYVRDLWLGTTTVASLNSNGEQGLGPSYGPALSSDGRYVSFWSDADNLVADDANGAHDVFLRNVEHGWTRRVSVAADGQQANWDSRHCAVSADARFVAFGSVADNLVAGDTNAESDAFIRDRGEPVAGDLDGDRDVDQGDLGILLADWGCGPPDECAGDIDGDGDTDMSDLLILLENWGTGT